MFGLGVTEIVIIFAVFAVIFFGGKKITGLGKSLGRFTGEFKKGKIEIENELKELKETSEEVCKDGEGDGVAKDAERSDKDQENKSN